MWGFVVCVWKSSDWRLGWTHVGPAHYEKDSTRVLLNAAMRMHMEMELWVVWYMKYIFIYFLFFFLLHGITLRGYPKRSVTDHDDDWV